MKRVSFTIFTIVNILIVIILKRNGESDISGNNILLTFDLLLQSKGDDIMSSRIQVCGLLLGALVTMPYDVMASIVLSSEFRISEMGPDGDICVTAFSPAVSYNDSINEYLMVWEGEDDIAPLVDNEDKVFYQRVDVLIGSEIGEDTRLSNMGPDGSTDYFVATLRFTSRKNQVDENVGNVQIEVQRVGSSSDTVTVDFSTTDGTATVSDVYTATSVTLTFAPDDRSRKGALSILDKESK